jgi:thiol-disulfide isomerase/thioredoxin
MPEVPRFGWRTLVVSTVLALIAAVAVVVVLGGSDDGDSDKRSSVVTIPLVPDGEHLDPDEATFTEFDGEVVPLSSLRGTPVVVNFFASSCIPCITEMPAFEAVHQDVGDQVTFLGLAVADRKDEAQDLVERTKVTYRTAQDRDASVIEALGGGTHLPSTVLIDADGNVVARHLGQLDADELRDLLAEELGITP